MKIAYILFGPEKSSGVIKKLKGQIEGFKNNNISVTMYILYNSLQEFLLDEYQKIFKPYDIHFIKIATRMNSKFNTFIYRKNCYKYLKNKLRNYEYIYVRTPFADYYLYKLCKKYNKKIILEINTIVSDELKMTNAKISYFVNKLFISKVIKNSYKCVCVTNQIAEFYKKYKNNTIVIPNGIFPNNYNLYTENELIEIYKDNIFCFSKNKEIHLLAVANISKWHGIDRLIKGLNKYYLNLNIEIKVFLHIVGDGIEKDNLINLVDNDLKDKVIFYSYKNSEELRDIYKKIHIGVGSLAIYRKGLSESCSLKNREYSLFGLPFIDASYDKDFEDYSYILKIENNDFDIDVNKIVEFYLSFYNVSNYRNKIVNFAKDNLIWDKKIKNLIFRINNE